MRSRFVEIFVFAELERKLVLSEFANLRDRWMRNVSDVWFSQYMPIVPVRCESTKNRWHCGWHVGDSMVLAIVDKWGISCRLMGYLYEILALFVVTVRGDSRVWVLLNFVTLNLRNSGDDALFRHCVIYFEIRLKIHLSRSNRAFCG